MQTYQPTLQPSFNISVKKQSLIARFFAWCENQDRNRFAWLAVILAGHGCILAPLTLLTVFAAGSSLTFWCLTMGAMAISLISNLAAMPTKVTIPIFFFSVLIDLVVVALCVNQLIQSI